MSDKRYKLPLGFKASGVHCGIKKNGNKDLALIVSDIPAQAAGVYTKNIVKGHSLKWTMQHVKGSRVKAITINSGNANACVGPAGDADAELIADYTAKIIGCDKNEVLLGSTGVIGFRLPIQNIKAGIDNAYEKLSADGASDAASAIMTTDTIKKEISVDINLSGKTATIYGMAKGSGMIHPDMATLIVVFLTDAAISDEMLQKALSSAVNKSFNRVSIDGDMSECDMVLMLANGKAGNPVIEQENDDFRIFAKELEKAAIYLAKLIAKDGEGATKLVEIRVINAPDDNTAHVISNAISKSLLVKTAIFGQDANWGRIINAMGYSGALFNPETVDIWLGGLQVCKDGTGLVFDEEKAAEILSRDEILIAVDLKMGTSSDTMWTCDLSYDYVKINSSYRS
ncbi:MAG: bifunctional glutamate N-acetyltransferase/amino-acid acetyltransferase ArgJ [Clostridiaceae bacterium]|jgi:glutamate N-acetyltransferase/amino-acid N-acetyltransferase|nr:bifunctional glutamate N-acetyltransferase/amino-acid acetyltransferase ArgJ [Clostridiaceae bacterium]